MAVIAWSIVHGADREAHDRLEDAVATVIDSRGGPPDGLMVHIGHPDGDRGGFAIVEVWKSEDDFRSWWDDVIGPALSACGLSATEPEIGAVWSLARP